MKSILAALAITVAAMAFAVAPEPNGEPWAGTAVPLAALSRD